MDASSIGEPAVVALRAFLGRSGRVGSSPAEHLT
ncbi:hypothetical protein J2W56_003320 [Nocardia kruczakiae]|uniref:Uncharacterized protein n=1 Tax=Nocardia kruczakiae TaxID=261477 RepID=A0ABU1XG94_9NOCA|nr:hypothetical protein [Nocardia kruczakiae]